MKLKKIASLALAGIMAVSMLAGCSNNSSSSSSEPTTPPVDSSLATAVNDKMSDAQKNIITFGTDADLNSNLESYAYTIDLSHAETSGWFATTSVEAKTLATLVDAETGADAITGSKWTDATKEGTYKALNLMVVTGNYTDKGLAEQIYKKIGSYITSTNYPSESTNGDYRYDYEGDIAVVTVNDVLGTQANYVVAITVTRTATEIAHV